MKEADISTAHAPDAPTTLHFDVSSGLKSVLGSELITNDEVAIFELVKNSFDAGASQVDIYFDDKTIVVADNGSGMSQEDIEKKWLFVAYSSKRQRATDFRDEIADRRRYAGSKGIGRFSSDRLGEIVILQSRPRSAESGPVHVLRVDWNRFDANHFDRFESIPVEYAEKASGFSIPAGVLSISHGTAITIEQLRKLWKRDDILRLPTKVATNCCASARIWNPSSRC